MTIWDHVCCVGYGLHARAEAFTHLLRGHRLKWRGGCIEPWTGHMGCIVCEACPDSSLDEEGQRSGFVFWSRDWALMRWCAQHVCGWLGHQELKHPQRPDGTGAWIDIPEQWYCFRCVADVDAPGERPHA